MIIKIEERDDFYSQLIGCLKKGSIIALPTDTGYGLCVDGTNPTAVEKLSNLKKKANEPYVFFISKTDMPKYAVIVKRRLVDYFLPGPITVILKKIRRVISASTADKRAFRLRGNGAESAKMTTGLIKQTSALAFAEEKIGIRIPQVDFILKLLNMYPNPLVVTNANFSGEKPLTSAQEIAMNFPEAELIIDGGVRWGLAATVLDLTTTPVTVRRKGAVPLFEIEKIYGRTVALDNSLKFHLLFVCTGNSCRSPMAVGIFKTLIDNSYVDVCSAGTAAIAGLPVNDYAKKVVREFGGLITDHRTRPLSKDLIAWADLVLVMAYPHYEAVLELWPEAVVKTFLLREYKRRFKYNEVADPLGKDISAYRDAALKMYPSLKLVAKDIEKRFKK